jgi:hypothetical protein
MTLSQRVCGVEGGGILTALSFVGVWLTQAVKPKDTKKEMAIIQNLLVFDIYFCTPNLFRFEKKLSGHHF